MTVMSAKSPRETYWNDRATFRTDASVRDALSTIKSRLGRSRKLDFRGRKPTEEAIFGALVLWADAQDVRALEELLAPFMAQLEVLVDEGEGGAQEKPPVLPKGEVEGITSTTVSRKSKGKPGHLSGRRVQAEGDRQAI